MQITSAASHFNLLPRTIQYSNNLFFNLYNNYEYLYFRALSERLKTHH